MSLLNMIVGSDRTYITTDSGTYDAGGRVATLAPKAIICERQGLVIATAGRVTSYSLFEGICACEHLPRPQFMLELPRIVRSVVEKSGVDPAECASIIAVGGYSYKHECPFGLVLATGASTEVPELVPYCFTPRKVLLLPFPDGISKSLLQRVSADPVPGSLPLIERQRRVNFGTPEEPQYCVAGNIDMISVSAEGFAVQPIETYPATIGEVVPAPA